MHEKPDTDWSRILDEDESLLWSGRPSAALQLRKKEFFLVFLALGLIVVSTLALVAANNDDSAPLWVIVWFGALLVLGVALLPIVLIKDRNRRARMHYALTDRRALVLIIGQPATLFSYPIALSNRLVIAPHRDGLSHVYFRDESLKVAKVNLAPRTPAEIGFEFIRDAEVVYELLRKHGAGHCRDNTDMTKGVSVDLR